MKALETPVEFLADYSARETELDRTATGPTGELSSTRDDHAQRIDRSILYMLEHLSQPLQVANLAAMAHVSPSHFFALFKRRTGCAPIDFFTRLRMHYACRLLDRTTWSVKEVAGALGYSDPFYFSRVFKAVNHVAPSEYRNLAGEERESLRHGILPGELELDLPQSVNRVESLPMVQGRRAA